MKFPKYSVILMVGPTGCGKSTLCQQFSFQGKVQIISSDNLRREILGAAYDKYDSKMMPASRQAFNLMKAKLVEFMRYPCQTEYIFIDSTGLDKRFREEIKQLAFGSQYNCYAIVMDTPRIKEHENQYLYSNQLRRFKTEVLPSITREKLTGTLRIKELTPEWNKIIELDLSNSHSEFIDTVIGDVHGCYDEFVELLGFLGFAVKDGKIEGAGKFVLVGDIVDKGPKVPELIELLYNNQDKFILVEGNHERKFTRNHELEEDIQQYFSSDKLDDVSKVRLTELISKAVPFYKCADYIVTHAPCRDKFLGKTDDYSIKKQRGFHYPKAKEFDSIEKYEKALEEALGFMKEDSYTYAPYHICGHIALADVWKWQNKIMLDTGCATGGKLTALRFMNGKPKFISVPSKQPKTEVLPNINKHSFSIKDLTEDQEKRLRWLMRDKIAYISGTMSPPAASIERNVLEDIDGAYDYYKSCGINRVMLQIKHMGSRCNLYLSNNLEECKAVSRNGYVIKHIPQEKFEEWKNKFLGDNDFMILDGELMPWYFLGAGLVNDSYKPISTCIDKELEFLDKNGFDKALSDAVTECANSGYKSSMSKEERKEKFGEHKAEIYEIVRNIKQISNDCAKEYAATFKSQIEKYGSEGAVEFKPFAILKTVKDGKERNWTAASEGVKNEEMYSRLNKCRYLMVDLSSEESKEAGRQFVSQLGFTEEGVVVKPELVYNRGVAPYMKVRNSSYLTLVYGYDYLFMPKYEKMVQSKRVNSKIKASITEFELGSKLLDIPLAELTKDNAAYKQLLLKLICETENERNLDPRL